MGVHTDGCGETKKSVSTVSVSSGPVSRHQLPPLTVGSHTHPSSHCHQVGSEDGMSEYGDTERAGEDGVSIWQELQDETIRLESRKSSSSSQASTDSLDSAEDFTPVEINLGEIKEMLSVYRSKRRVSTSALGTNK